MMAYPLITPDTIPHLTEIGHVGWPFISAVTWSADGRRAAAAGAHGVGLWIDGIGGPPDQHLAADAPLKDAAFSPDGDRLATAGAYGYVDLWATATGTHLGAIAPAPSAQAAYDAVAWSADGRLLAFGGVDRHVYLWDMTANRLAHTLTGHTDEVTSLAFTPDGHRLSSGGWDARVRVWDTTTGASIAALEMLDWVRHVAISADARIIGATGKDGTVRLWNFPDLTPAYTWDAHTHGADCLAFHPSTPLTVTGGRDGAVRVWHTQTGAALATLTAHTRPVLAAAFHPRGHLLLTGSGDNTIRVWGVGSA